MKRLILLAGNLLFCLALSAKTVSLPLSKGGDANGGTILHVNA